MLPQDPSKVGAIIQKKSEDYLADLEKRLDEAHEKTRPLVRKVLKEAGEGWDSLPQFLDEVWTRPEFQDDHIRHLWQMFGLPGEAPIQKLMDSPPWRLMLDARGVAAYERDAVLEQPKRVHHADLLQLVYASGYKRIAVTDEEPLYRAASGVLVGRYPQSRVMKWAEFAACHV